MKSITATRILVLAAAALLLTAASTNASALFATFPGTELTFAVPESASLVMLGTGLFALARAIGRPTAAAEAQR
jgi:hypothetical protein